MRQANRSVQIAVLDHRLIVGNRLFDDVLRERGGILSGCHRVGLLGLLPEKSGYRRDRPQGFRLGQQHSDGTGFLAIVPAWPGTIQKVLCRIG